MKFKFLFFFMVLFDLLLSPVTANFPNKGLPQIFFRFNCGTFVLTNIIFKLLLVERMSYDLHEIVFP